MCSTVYKYYGPNLEPDWLLEQEELSALKREKVPRSLSFGSAVDIDTRHKDEDGSNERTLAQEHPANTLGKESHGVLRVSCKQVDAALSCLYSCSNLYYVLFGI